MLEMELAAEYAPQNIYVYVLDRKSPLLFHNQMKALANCFPNVFVLTKTYDMSSWGKNMNYALMSSLEFLARSRFSWKYVIFLQVSSNEIFNKKLSRIMMLSSELTTN
jgi:hypothetical protein